jgi:hypothetical protein
VSALVKYPSTLHLEGSKCAGGQTMPGQAAFGSLPDGLRVLEEKVDGDHCGIGYDPHDGTMFLQSHGAAVDPSDPRFFLFAEWAYSLESWLRETLGRRYVVFGDWMQHKHTVFYDRLDHLFLEYDVCDREAESFLSTEARGRLLSGLPLVPVPILSSAPALSLPDARKAILGSDGRRTSAFKTPKWRENLATACREVGGDPQAVAMETVQDDAGEGGYIKVEDGDVVLGRYKFILPGFMETIAASGSHWSSRRRLANLLAPGVDIFDFPSSTEAYSSR